MTKDQQIAELEEDVTLYRNWLFDVTQKNYTLTEDNRLLRETVDELITFIPSGLVKNPIACRYYQKICYIHDSKNICEVYGRARQALSTKEKLND